MQGSRLYKSVPLDLSPHTHIIDFELDGRDLFGTACAAKEKEAAEILQLHNHRFEKAAVGAELRM